MRRVTKGISEDGEACMACDCVLLETEKMARRCAKIRLVRKQSER